LFGLLRKGSREVIMFFNTFGIKNINACELRDKMDRKEDFLLLDVRTPQENASYSIAGSYLLPVQELSTRVGELPKNKEIVVYCRIGNRSAFAASYLSRLGYTVKNLEGGILSWATAEESVCARA
jgi:phage shock protein E